MSAIGVHKITEQFEQALAEYTGAPYVVCVDNMSNALFLCLMWERKKYGASANFPDTITIPKCTYPSVPCEILHAGFKVKFRESDWKGVYQLDPLLTFDSACRLTSNMYMPDTLMCVSFTGPYKHLKLSKGGAILLDDAEAYAWLKKARFSGRGECGYHDDDFDVNPVIGWNMYLIPELAARGLLLLPGLPKHNADLELKYPDLSKFKLWQQ